MRAETCLPPDGCSTDAAVSNAYLDVVPLSTDAADLPQPPMRLQPLEDNDDNILMLHQDLERFANRTKRATQTQIQFPGVSVSQNLNPDDLNLCWQLIKARFKRHELTPEIKTPQIRHQEQDARTLQYQSEKKLENLLKTYRAFREEALILTRKRAYARNGEYDGVASPLPPLPPPALPIDSETKM